MNSCLCSASGTSHLTIKPPTESPSLAKAIQPGFCIHPLASGRGKTLRRRMVPLTYSALTERQVFPDAVELRVLGTSRLVRYSANHGGSSSNTERDHSKML